MKRNDAALFEQTEMDNWSMVGLINSYAAWPIRLDIHVSRQTVYVALLNEGTPCWRPVEAEPVRPGVFRIVSSNPDPTDEEWEFPSNSVVICEERIFSDGPALVAVGLGNHAA